MVKSKIVSYIHTERIIMSDIGSNRSHNQYCPSVLQYAYHTISASSYHSCKVSPISISSLSLSPSYFFHLTPFLSFLFSVAFFFSLVNIHHLIPSLHQFDYITDMRLILFYPLLSHRCPLLLYL